MVNLYFQCVRCGDAFEESLPAYQQWMDCHGCGQYTAQQVWNIKLPDNSYVGQAPAMSPDPYWSGHVDPDVGYVTARTELNQRMEERDLRWKEPGMDRDASSRNRDIIERMKANQRQKVKEHFGSMTLDEIRRQARNEALLPYNQPIVVNQNQPENYPKEDYDE